MKYFLTVVLWIFIAHSIHADTFNIIVSGKPGGTFHTRAMLMHDYLLNQGHEVNLINGGNIAKSEQLYNSIDKPVIMPWMDSANVDKANIQPNEQTFGILEYTAPVLFCSIKYNGFDSDVITIGYSASWPKTIFEELEKSLQKQVKAIPYQNSGDLVLSLNSKEIDYIAISLTQLTKLPDGSCFGVTSEYSVNNTPTISSMVDNYKFSLISQHAYWIIKNYSNTNLIRKTLHNAIISDDYAKWLDNLNVVQNDINLDKDLSSSIQGAYDWGR